MIYENSQDNMRPSAAGDGDLSLLGGLGGAERPSEGAWSVSQFLHETESFLKTLGPFVIYGEISELKNYNHIFFTLKDSDDGSTVECAMWKSYAAALDFEPKKGDKVELYGKISIYTKNGSFKFTAMKMRKLGLGVIMEKLEALKRKLESEGLFSRPKRQIPRFINTVGVVTSADGRAIGDIVKTMESRNSGVRIILYPSLVQGRDAPASLISALEMANEHNECDVIIFGRGGGSFEDLLAFFDEKVVRAVAASKIPVISAVGHEADYSFSDFAADMRAQTPTRAAEFVTQVKKQDLYLALDEYLKRMTDAIYRLDDYQRMRLDAILKRLESASPEIIVENRRHNLDKLATRLNSLVDRQLSSALLRFNALNSRLSSFEPQSVVERRLNQVQSFISRLNAASDRHLECARERLDFSSKVAFFNEKLEAHKKALYDELSSKVHRIQATDYDIKLSKQESRCIELITRLKSLNPLYILDKGYSITFDEKGHSVNIDRVQKGDHISTRVRDGSIISEVLEVSKSKDTQ